MGRRLLITALVVTSISLALRLAWCTWAHVTPVSDYAEYHRYAVDWLETGQFGWSGRLAYRTPGYPAFLAGIYFFTGPSPRAAAIVQAVLGGLTSGLIVLLAGRIASLRTATLAGVLHTLWPTTFLYTPVLASENLALPVLVAITLLVAPASNTTNKHRPFNALGAGALSGLLLLIRPAALFFIPAFVLMATWNPVARRRNILSGILLLITTAGTLAPWLVRNAQLGFGNTTLSTTGGVNLWMGNNDAATTGGFCADVQFARDAGEYEQHQTYSRAALGWIRNNPAQYALLSGLRLIRMLGTEADHWPARHLWPTAANDDAVTAQFHSLEGKTPDPTLVRRGEIVGQKHNKLLGRLRRIYAPLLIAAAALALAQWRRYLVVLLPTACYVGGLSLTFAAVRFRELYEPLLLIPLAALIVDLAANTTELGNRPSRRAKTAIAVGSVAAVLLLHALGYGSVIYHL